jgi:hypothetical protein
MFFTGRPYLSQVTEISERKFLFYPVERSRLDKKPQPQGGKELQRLMPSAFFARPLVRRGRRRRLFDLVVLLTKSKTSSPLCPLGAPREKGLFLPFTKGFLPKVEFDISKKSL